MMMVFVQGIWLIVLRPILPAIPAPPRIDTRTLPSDDDRPWDSAKAMM